MDIDNFKRLNEATDNETVDKLVLPKYYEAIESHVFGRGHAYLQGGDECLILLPGSSETDAISLLQNLRDKIKSLTFAGGIKDTLTVSIGLCVADPECFLIDSEIRKKANRAEKHAKKEGKDCIATYRGRRFSETDLYVVGRERK